MTKRMAVLHTSFVFTNFEPVFKDLFKEFDFRMSKLSIL